MTKGSLKLDCKNSAQYFVRDTFACVFTISINAFLLLSMKLDFKHQKPLSFRKTVPFTLRISLSADLRNDEI